MILHADDVSPDLGISGPARSRPPGHSGQGHLSQIRGQQACPVLLYP